MTIMVETIQRQQCGNNKIIVSGNGNNDNNKNWHCFRALLPINSFTLTYLYAMETMETIKSVKKSILAFMVAIDIINALQVYIRARECALLPLL